MAVGAIAISPNQQYLAYSLDVKGGETCQLYVKHFDSGKVWGLRDPKKLSNSNEEEEESDLLEVDGSVVWNDKSDTLFYVTMDDTHRPYRLYRRRIFDSNGEWIDAKEEDELLLEESDELYNLRISKSFDGRYLMVRCSSKESSEVHYLDLRPGDDDSSKGKDDDMDTKSNNKLACIAKRQSKVLYRVTHCQGYWLVQTNIGGLPNLSLKACPVGKGEMENWKDVVDSSGTTGDTLAVFDGSHERSIDVSSMLFDLSVFIYVLLYFYLWIDLIPNVQ